MTARRADVKQRDRADQKACGQDKPGTVVPDVHRSSRHGGGCENPTRLAGRQHLREMTPAGDIRERPRFDRRRGQARPMEIQRPGVGSGIGRKQIQSEAVRAGRGVDDMIERHRGQKRAVDEAGEIPPPLFHRVVGEAGAIYGRRKQKAMHIACDAVQDEIRNDGQLIIVAGPIEPLPDCRLGPKIYAIDGRRVLAHRRIENRKILVLLFGRHHAIVGGDGLDDVSRNAVPGGSPLERSAFAAGHARDPGKILNGRFVSQNQVGECPEFAARHLVRGLEKCAQRHELRRIVVQSVLDRQELAFGDGAQLILREGIFPAPDEPEDARRPDETHDGRRDDRQAHASAPRADAEPRHCSAWRAALVLTVFGGHDDTKLRHPC